MVVLMYRFIYYMLEGAVYILAFWLGIVRFFRYPVKKSEFQKKSCFILTVGYALSSTLINTLVAGPDLKNEKTINGLLMLVLLIYWIRQIIRRKWEAIFVTITSFEIIMIFWNIIFSAEQIILKAFPGVQILEMCLNIVGLVVLLLLLWILSILSARNRKASMPLPLVVSVFLVLLLSDNLLVLFDPEKYQEKQSFISFRFLYDGQRSGDYFALFFLSIMFIVLLISLLLIIKESEAVYFRNKNTINEYYLETQKAHVEGIMESNRQIRKIKHDMKNHVIVLQELMKQEDYDELGRYLESMAERVDRADENIHVGNEIADAILLEKNKKAKELQIQLMIEGAFALQEMSAIDICTILGNILDNAIEAVQALESSQRKIILQFRRNEHFFYISEENPVDHPVDIRDNMVLTTKKEKKEHGFGLVNIMETVEKYEGECVILTEGEGESRRFRIEMMIPLSVS